MLDTVFQYYARTGREERLRKDLFCVGWDANPQLKLTRWLTCWCLPFSAAGEDRRRRARWRRILRRRDQCRVWHAGVRQSGMHRTEDTGRGQPRQLVIRRVWRSKRHAVSASSRPSYSNDVHWSQATATATITSPCHSGSTKNARHDHVT